MKRILCFALTVCFLVGCLSGITVSVSAVDVVSDFDLLREWGVFGQAVSPGETLSRLETGDLLLRLTGKYNEAASYLGMFSYRDAETRPCALNRLAYLYNHREYGMDGDENGNFRPNEPIEAKAFYKTLLALLGYQCGKDYTWDSIHEMVRSLGTFGDVMFVEPFCANDMSIAVWEALNLPCKGESVTLGEKLHDSGAMPSALWTKYRFKVLKQPTDISHKVYDPGNSVNKSGAFTFNQVKNMKTITDYNFMYNACFHYSGVYYGTLPTSNSQSQRKAFADALKTIGAHTLRWPGGNTVHWYFMEDNGKQYTDKLFYDASDFGTKPGGMYDPDDPDDAYYTKCWDFMDFCKENNIDVLMQVNTSYYVDDKGTAGTGDDQVRSIFLSTLNTKTDGSGNRYTMPGYYDRNRTTEAATALRKNLQEMKKRGYECHMWELGNEDHFKDYTGESDYSKNEFMKNLFRLYVAYATVIKEEFPGAVVCVDTVDVPQAVSKGLITAEEAKLLDAITDHYPFARWGSPTETTETKNAWEFAARNDVQFDQAWQNRLEMDWGVSQRMMTESTAYRFQNWGTTTVEHTFAHALTLAHNWGQGVFDSGWTLNCLHDLESPWFGFLQHNSTFNTGTRDFWRKNEAITNVRDSDIPESYKFFNNRYYTNPAGRAYELLGRHIGGLALHSAETNMGRYVAGYSTVNGHQVTVTVVNRLNETRPVTLTYKGISVPAQSVTATCMSTDDIFAVMPEDYSYDENMPITIKGNAGDSNRVAAEFDVPPFSITTFTITVD